MILGSMGDTIGYWEFCDSRQLANSKWLKNGRPSHKYVKYGSVICRGRGEHPGGDNVSPEAYSLLFAIKV